MMTKKCWNFRRGLGASVDVIRDRSGSLGSTSPLRACTNQGLPSARDCCHLDTFYSSFTITQMTTSSSSSDSKSSCIDVVTAKLGYHLFDLFQLQEQSMEIIPALSPVWTSPLHNLEFVSDYNISGVVLVNTAGFEPSIRVTLRTSNGFVYLEIPALRDIERDEVKLSSAQFDLATTQNGVGVMS
ncbi:hypothetical protein BC629DRAFT_313978 [Irpex lacteus]|nr:hypothetical protein BC629DRAFT_313978 [Irpex lacteus]